MKDNTNRNINKTLCFALTDRQSDLERERFDNIFEYLEQSQVEVNVVFWRARYKIKDSTSDK